jgi:hypothetical protein
MTRKQLSAAEQGSDWPIQQQSLRALAGRKTAVKVHYVLKDINLTSLGCAVAQAVSGRLLTAVAQVRVRNKSCGMCGGQRGTGAGSPRVLRFPLPLLHSVNSSTIIMCHPGPKSDYSNSGLGSNPAP